MLDLISTPRIVNSSDWAIGLFVLSLLLIVITRTVFPVRFAEFIKLGVSDKYLKIYRDNNPILNWFNLSLFAVQIISVSFFILLLLDAFTPLPKTNGVGFIRIATVVTTFVLSKYIFEKIIAICFSIEEVADHFNNFKLSFRMYGSMLLLPVVAGLYFTDYVNVTLLTILCIAAVIINLGTYFFIIKSFQNVFTNKLFYFILYLCTLEIAPYYFMYYWFIKS